MSAEVVATGLTIPEGPVVLPDGRIAFVEQLAGRVSAFDPRDGSVMQISQGPGSPNGATLGEDGCIYVTQNGGVVGDMRPKELCDPGIQRITLDGEITTIATEVDGVTLKAPNDLAFGPDGCLYFTDPAHGYNPDPAKQEPGRLFALGNDDDELILELHPSYPNGIGFTVEGRLLWVESYGRFVCTLGDSSVLAERRAERAARRPGQRVQIMQLPDEHIPDGFAVANDGRIFIATATSHGVTVISPDGQVLEHLLLDDNAFATNCCFDGSALYVTDFHVENATDVTLGRLWRIDTDATGVQLHTGAV